MKELLQQQPEYKKALCALYLVDYVCLPEYALPPECAHLEETRMQAENSLRTQAAVTKAHLVAALAAH